MLIFAAALYYAGRREGIRHAIYDSCVWTVEIYDQENPDETARADGTDQTIFIDLDGDLYEHGMYQG